MDQAQIQTQIKEIKYLLAVIEELSSENDQDLNLVIKSLKKIAVDMKLNQLKI